MLVHHTQIYDKLYYLFIVIYLAYCQDIYIMHTMRIYAYNLYIKVSVLDGTLLVNILTMDKAKSVRFG